MSQTVQTQTPLESIDFDPFEKRLIAPLRHFLIACRAPQTQAWQRAFAVAAENWGETQGLAVAYALWPVVRHLHALRGQTFESNDPLDQSTRAMLTPDEVQAIAMLHYMRRDETALARDVVEAITEGQMDVDVIRAGLSFADRFPSGQRMRLRGQPALYVVS